MTDTSPKDYHTLMLVFSKTLCLGGAIKYELKDGCEISEDWILSNVVPNLKNMNKNLYCFGNSPSLGMF